MALSIDNLKGNEIADDYIRNHVPAGRWADAWAVFKGSFGKLVLLNLIVLVTFVPAIAVMYFREAYIAGLGSVYPFNPTIIYPHYPDVQGLTERLILSADLTFYSLLIVAGFIASIGIAGAAHTIRRLVNTHGQFSFRSFLHGIKSGYFNTVLPVTVFLVMLFGTVLVGDWKDIVMATGGNVAGAITAYVFAIMATVLVGVYCAWMFAVGTSYRVKILQLFKNSFVLATGTVLQTVIIAALALVPVWLFLLGGLFRWLSFIAFIGVGFVYILLFWVAFTQWAFDSYITPDIKPVEQVKRVKTEKEIEQEKREEERRVAGELLAAGRSELVCKPIMPVSGETAIKPFGRTFNRSSLAAANEQRAKLAESIAEYEKAHENDAAYSEYRKLFAERDKALPTDGKKGKKKKVSAANLLK